MTHLSRLFRKFQPFAAIPAGKALGYGSSVLVPTAGDGVTILATFDESTEIPIVEAFDPMGRLCFLSSSTGLEVFDAAGNVSMRYTPGKELNAGNNMVLSIDTELAHFRMGDSLVNTWPITTDLMSCFVGQLNLTSASNGSSKVFPRRTEPSEMDSLMKYGLPFEDFISGRDLDGTDARTHHKGICLLGPPLLTQHVTFPTRQYCDGITGEILNLIEDQQLSKLNDNNS